MRKYLVLVIMFSMLFSPVFVVAQVDLAAPDISNIEEVAKSIWSKAFIYLKGIYIFLWNTFSHYLNKQVEIRGPEIRAEFKKEVEELKEDLPKTTKNLWERFKNLIGKD